MNNQDVIKIGEAIAAGLDKGLQFKPEVCWEFRPEGSPISEEDWNAAMIRIRQIFSGVDAKHRNK